MDEKEKDIELENVSDAEENAAQEQENAEIKYEENDNWQFDASAPTLEGNLELGEDYELELPEAQDAPKNAEEQKTTAEAPADDDEDDDDEGKKEKRNFIVNKTAVKVAVIAGVCAVVAAIIAFLGVRLFLYPNSSEIMTPGNTALTVGETKVSVGEYNYYYSSIVESYLSYAQYGYYDIDSSKDYAEQETTDADGNKISWLQLFKDDTIRQIQYVTAYYEAAVEAGITLSDEEAEQIDQAIKNAATQASQAGMSVKEFLSENFGEHAGLKTYRKVIEQNTIAQKYYYQKQLELASTEDEINAYFEANQDKYKAISFGYIEMTYDPETENLADVEARAQAYCDRIKSLDDMKALIPEIMADRIEEWVSYGYYNDAESAVESLSTAIEYSRTYESMLQEFNPAVADWVHSADVSVGDTTYIIDEDYNFVNILIKLSEPKLDESEYYSVRHILIMPKAETVEAEDGTVTQAEPTEEAWAAAEAEANRILEEYNAGEKTEAAFAALAEQYSEDTGSTSASGYGYYGGQIFETALGAMVPEFEAWSIDDSRQYGDVGIVKSKYGYHIMYFVYDAPAYLYGAKNDSDIEKEDAFVEACVVTEGPAIDKTTVAKPTSK